MTVFTGHTDQTTNGVLSYFELHWGVKSEQGVTVRLVKSIAVKAY